MSIFIIASLYIPSLFFRLLRKNIWLICERIDSAQDNGWIFYQWVRNNHPKDNAYFVLDSDASSFDANDDYMIKWGSLRHYLYYLSSDIFVTSMFNKPRPNVRVCSYFEMLRVRKPKVMYIRHGICQHGLEEHLYKILKVRLFVCGAKREYQYFIDEGDYPDGYVQYTGFARYDDLLNGSHDGKYILIIPTWRRYLKDNTCLDKCRADFIQSNYYNTYVSLLNNETLLSIAKDNGYYIKFCLHKEFRVFQDLFDKIRPEIELVGEDESIHQLLMGASLVVTDFSSIFFDVAYMHKPVLYYHFDLIEYRQKHFSEGYFSYENDGFGPIALTEDELIQNIKNHLNNGVFEMKQYYKERVDSFFELRDNHNCERIYNAIKQIECNIHQ